MFRTPKREQSTKSELLFVIDWIMRCHLALPAYMSRQSILITRLVLGYIIEKGRRGLCKWAYFECFMAALLCHRTKSTSGEKKTRIRIKSGFDKKLSIL